MENVSDVRTFVGIDAHAARCSIKALSPAGESLRVADSPTTSESLRRALKDLPRPIWVLLEASTMAPFVRDGIERGVDRVIVCETRENRWVAKSEDKSDPADADRLARLLRMGEFKEVHVPRKKSQELRELVILLRKAVGDVIRAKNRIKSKYRQHGIAVRGTTVYTVKGRVAWMEKVRSPAVRFLLEVLYGQLDAAEEVHGRLIVELRKRMNKTAAYRRLITVPGFGPKVCPIFIAVVDDPERFKGKRKLWSYAGLGVRRRSSGSMKRAQEGGSKGGNRLLKYAAMLAAHTAVRADNRLSRHHEEMIKSGIDPAMAARTTARNILTTALAMWKNQTVYRDHP